MGTFEKGPGSTELGGFHGGTCSRPGPAPAPDVLRACPAGGGGETPDSPSTASSSLFLPPSSREKGQLRGSSSRPRWATEGSRSTRVNLGVIKRLSILRSLVHTLPLLVSYSGAQIKCAFSIKSEAW